ncbi:hypothetical protein M758_2G149800 [Ceratodon purpureus]|uniref:E3 ubiquitin-protein ligase PRT1 n=1 Tax=Ceratodon purpureus TaxID=3225 RepID=A0A8T0J0I5_CERPU|nr:hypothetical protein KC19_2G220500 [Ceratodon purpureus]KAG0626763.1 hypothetical protein M758_2G149800 [Ceratodon purpureus]KAG0626764.1 hypothetical protein M758_2G149800 [Ceratodon purpureus]
METHDDAEQFQCIICLELVYKPIVHACGHLFCFWCVHRAMDGAYKNLCPLCRRPYMHFPRICEQLHFVLLKAVHDKYLTRAKEVQEEEAQGGIFSPEINPQPPRIRNMPLDIAMEDTPPENTSEEASSIATETVSSSNPCSERGSVCLSNSASSNSDDPNPNPSKEADVMGSFKGKAPMPDEGEETLPGGQELLGKTENLDILLPDLTDLTVTTLDLACLHCGNLLYRPVVLNCGHMFCEHCVVVGDDESVSCPSCKAEHPGMFPQVCLELHHYIDRIFPLEYAQRSLQVAAEERDRPPNRPQLPPSEPQDLFLKSRIRKSLPGPVHRAVGCDGCGMMPIVGKRFQCQDCPEAIGFDLCQKCHETGCVVGRFNQRHTPEHRMVEVRLPSRGSMGRQFLDAMANRSLNIMDLRVIAEDCNESEALQVLLMQHRIGNLGESPQGNGASTLETSDPQVAPSADGAADGVVEDGVREIAEDYVLQDGDDHHEVYVLQDGDDHHEAFMHSHGEDGEFDDHDDEEEFEAFSRDDEDIDFFRVVFHS